MNYSSILRTNRAVLRTISGFIRYPDSFNYLCPWVRSMLPWHSTLSDEAPWISFRARIWLEAHLNPEMSVFEWGSGGSTLFFARRVGTIISVEHDKEWYHQVLRMLAEQGISNYHYFLREPEEVIRDGSSPDFTSAVKEYAGMSFESYVRIVDDYLDGCFDLVFVDGRARVSCISHALRKIRPGGYLFLDNSNRGVYEDAHILLNNFDRTDLFGLLPYMVRWQQSTVWRIAPDNTAGTILGD